MTPEELSVIAGGDPTDEEMAAIVGAASVLLLGPTAVVTEEQRAPRWRFSGRWWTKPVPLQRRRP